MGLPNERSFRGWNMASTGISIIARRTPTNPLANVSDACSALSHPATPNDSSLPMAPSGNTSARADIGCPLPSTVKK
jgi:hypothetical protein